LYLRTHCRRITDDVQVVHERGGDQSGGVLSPALKEQVLDAIGDVAVAHADEDVLVEVLLFGPHAAHVQGNGGLDGLQLAGLVSGSARRSTERTMSTTSRVRSSGRANGWPYHPSTTCGPETPKPRITRPWDRWSRVRACIASDAGVRPDI